MSPSPEKSGDGSGPRGSVTTRKPAGDMVEVVHVHHLSQMNCNANGQRVAADRSEVLEQQVSRSYGVARAGQADDFDVMALPIHLASTRAQGQGSGDGTEIGKGEFECWVDGHGEAQGHNGSVALHGPLRLPVPRRRRPVGRHGTAVILEGRSGARLVSKVSRLLMAGVLHGCQVEPAA